MKAESFYAFVSRKGICFEQLVARKAEFCLLRLPDDSASV